VGDSKARIDVSDVAMTNGLRLGDNFSRPRYRVIGAGNEFRGYGC